MPIRSSSTIRRPRCDAHGRGGSALKVAGLILRGYAEIQRGPPGAGMKLRAAFAPVDIADNLSYDYGRLRMPVLQYCPSWGLLLALATPGIALLLFARRGRTPWVVGILAANAAAILLPIALGRYRLEALPLLAIGAAQTLRLAVIGLRQRRWRLMAIPAGATGRSSRCFSSGCGRPRGSDQSPPVAPAHGPEHLDGCQRQPRRFVKARRRWRAELSIAASALPGAAQERLQARRDEITCLIFALIDSIRSGDTQLADSLQQRAVRCANAARRSAVSQREEVAAFLRKRFPPHIAGSWLRAPWPRPATEAWPHY
jgi:hypothetical protein